MSFFLRISVVSVILLLLTPIAPAGELPKVTSKHWTNEYDRYFKKYTKRYFGPGFVWKWFKA